MKLNYLRVQPEEQSSRCSGEMFRATMLMLDRVTWSSYLPTAYISEEIIILCFKLFASCWQNLFHRIKDHWKNLPSEGGSFFSLCFHHRYYFFTDSRVCQQSFGDFLVCRRHCIHLSASPGSIFHCVPSDALLEHLDLLRLFLFSTVLSQCWLCFSHTQYHVFMEILPVCSRSFSAQTFVIFSQMRFLVPSYAYTPLCVQLPGQLSWLWPGQG